MLEGGDPTKSYWVGAGSGPETLGTVGGPLDHGPSVGSRGRGGRGVEGMVEGGNGFVGRGTERPGERRRQSLGHLRESNNEG